MTRLTLSSETARWKARTASDGGTLVVVGDDLDLPAVDAALGVDLVGGELHRLRDRGAGHRLRLGDHPDPDRIGGPRRPRKHRARRQQRGQHAPDLDAPGVGARGVGHRCFLSERPHSLFVGLASTVAGAGRITRGGRRGAGDVSGESFAPRPARGCGGVSRRPRCPPADFRAAALRPRLVPGTARCGPTASKKGGRQVRNARAAVSGSIPDRGARPCRRPTP